MFIPLHDDTTYREQTVTQSVSDLVNAAAQHFTEALLVTDFMKQLLSIDDHNLGS